MRKSTWKKNGESGFSLLEVMMALVFFAVGFLGIANMQAVSIRGNAKAMNMTAACQIGTAIMEDIMAMAYDDPRLNDDDGDGQAGLQDSPAADEVNPSNPVKAGGLGGGLYNVYWNVAKNWPIENMKTIRVIVTWSADGQSKKAHFDTMKRWGT